MAYIFMDESGDLGFNFTKGKTSQYFVVTCLFVLNRNKLSRTVNKTFKSMSKRELSHHSGILHATHESPKTRMKCLQLINQQDVSVISIYLNKRKVFTRLQDEKQVLYNYVTNILLDRIMTKRLIPTDEPIILVASRRETNKFLNENFADYLVSQTQTNHKLDFSVEIKSPHEDKCLQVADMICWSIYRKREHQDESYFRIIQDKIVEESPLFP